MLFSSEQTLKKCKQINYHQGWSIFSSFLSTAFNYFPNVKNKLLNQGRFWPFAPRQLLGVIYFLISSFQLNLANNYYFHEKLEVFTL